MKASPSRSHRHIVLSCLLGALAASAVAQTSGAQKSGERTVRPVAPVQSPPRSEQVDHLAEARKAARLITGKKGEERDQSIRQAIAAYEAARASAKDDAEVGGEAAFRIGELHLRLKENDKATSAFEDAFARARDKFGARALLEVAHVVRRARRLDDAVKAYERVEKEFPATPRAMDARLWIGRTDLDRKAYDKARESFRSVVASSKDPIDRIEALDWTARSFLRERRLDEATAVIEEADKEFHDLAASDERDGPRVRRALENMGARDGLQRAKERLIKGAKDASGEADDADGKNVAKKKGGR